jgi:hypothetical protein
MRKYFPITVKNKSFIYECEVSEMLPKPFNLKDNERQYKFVAPKSLVGPGNVEFIFSFFLSDTKEGALTCLMERFIESFEIRLSTRRIPYTAQDVEDRLKLVEFIPLQ